MLWRFLHTLGQDSGRDSTTPQRSFRLQAVLWTLWTLVVIAVGYLNGYAGLIAQRPNNTLGLVINSVLAGLIGLVVMTLIEVHLEPWRFPDNE